MPNAIANHGATSAHKFLSSSSSEFWNAVGVFEDALHAKTHPDQLVKDVKDQLASLGIGTLRMLCERSAMTYLPDGSVIDLVDNLLNECKTSTLIQLREFMRRRAEEISEVFEQTFSVRERSRFDADIEQLGKRKGEGLRPFSRLILLYRNSPETLKEILFLQFWRSASSYAEFESAEQLSAPKAIGKAIIARQGLLEKALTAAISGREVRMHGLHTLADGTVVVVLHREYNPTIKRDFRQDFNVHYGCGLIIFGFHEDRRRVQIKTGNSRLIEAIESFVAQCFSTELRPLENDVFSDYEPKTLEQRLLGHYDPAAGIEVVAAKFRRSGLPTRCSLTISSPSATTSLQEPLQELLETKGVQIRALDDLESMTLTYEGKQAEITVDSTKSGAVIFRFDDSGWRNSLREEFEEKFELAFGIPVNKLINPERLQMGGVRVIAYLMSIHEEREIQPYQRKRFDSLVKAKILEREPQDAKACNNPLCRARSVAILSEELENCKACDRPLETTSIPVIVRNNTQIMQFVNRVVSAATGWEIGKPRAFEGTGYYPLQRPDDLESPEICLLLRDRLPSLAREKFQRSSLPVLVIEPHTDDRYVFLDVDGIGRMSFAYLFTSQEIDEERKQCEKCIRNLVASLLRHQQEWITRAARQSYNHLVQGTSGDKGHVYETDIFNVLRFVLPYSYQLGREGKGEPDGFVCVPEYEDGIEDVPAWNWSYDAKHSDKAKGYDLSSDEQRKIVDYIDKFRVKLHFAKKDRKLRAHVLISNNLSDAMMKKTARFVFSDVSGVQKKNRDVVLVRMDQGFVTRLYELSADNFDAFQRRRPLLGKMLVRLLSAKGPDGYSSVAASDAEALVNELLELPAIESTLTREEIIKGLDSPA
jgi:hypothetical protein